MVRLESDSATFDKVWYSLVTQNGQFKFELCCGARRSPVPTSGLLQMAGIWQWCGDTVQEYCDYFVCQVTSDIADCNGLIWCCRHQASATGRHIVPAAGVLFHLARGHLCTISIVQGDHRMFNSDSAVVTELPFRVTGCDLTDRQNV